MSGGWPSQAGNRGGGAGRSPKGDYTAPRFPPAGLGLDGRGAAGPNFNSKKRQPQERQHRAGGTPGRGIACRDETGI